jgi:iron complex outermembrane receptor protein
MLDGHLRTQLGAFYMKYNDFQLDVINPLSGQNGVVNLADSTIKGFEASFQAKAGGFSLDGGLSYVKSKLSPFTLINKWTIPAGVSLPQCAAGVANGPTCFNYTYVSSSGGPNLYSPEWTWNMSAAYRFQADDGWSVTPRVGYAYIGSQWAYPTYQPATDLIRARGLVQASLAVEKDAWKIEAYGTNLANKFYVAGQNGKNELYGAPREYGVRVTTRF